MEPIYELAGNFKNGYASVKLNGKWGIIDQNGEQASDIIYDEKPCLQDGYVYVKYHGKWGIIDKHGCTIFDTIYDDIFLSQNELAIVCVDQKWSVINLNGTYIMELTCDGAHWLGKEFIEIVKNKKHGVIKINGELIIKPQYDSIKLTEEEVFVVGNNPNESKNDWKYGLVDLNGNLLVSPIYSSQRNVMKFHEGLAKVWDNNKFGYINTRGELVIEPQFEFAENFAEGVAIIRKDDKYGVIDNTGRYIVENIYEKFVYNDLTQKCAEDIVVILEWWHELFGYLNYKNGEVVAPMLFNYAWSFSEGFGRVRITEEQMLSGQIPLGTHNIV